MRDDLKRLNLQLFADGGDGGGDGAGDGAATAVVNAPDDAEARLRALGVPEEKLAQRAKRAGRQAARQQSATVVQAAPAPAQTVTDNAADSAAENTEGEKPQTNQTQRMSWDEIMADPEYNKKMQETMQARLKSAKNAEETLSKLAPALEVLTRKYGLDLENLDADKLSEAISNDDSYYEDKAFEMGVSVETAKHIDQMERESARIKAEEERSIREQKMHDHVASITQQAEALKAQFPSFDLREEMQNPVFIRMTSPDSGLTVEDAYYAIHRKEIQAAGMQAAAQRTAQAISNNIRSGRSRPTENGTQSQAPSTTTFDYAHATREQREQLKARIRAAAAQGKKLYPGQL